MTMEQYVFTDQVKKYFHYLTEDYGFSIVAEEKSNRQAFGNSLIEFRSSTASVIVTLDRGQVLIDMGPYPEVPGYQFSLVTVIEFLASGLNEPVYIFPEQWDNYYDMIDWQVMRLAGLLRQYCTPVLKGEFSKWKEMDEIRTKTALDDYKRLTGKDPIKIESEEAKKKISEEEDRRQNRARTGKESPEK
jgi:hypothetical protein